MVKNRVDGETNSDINVRENKEARLSENKIIGLVQKRTNIEVGRLEDVLVEEVEKIPVIMRRGKREPRLL